jgi:outer membrane immunogenic protein
MAKFPVAAGIALALVAGSALAADLPSRKGPPPVYVPPPPAFSWTGLYGGVNIGYGFGNGDLMQGGQIAAQNIAGPFFDGPIGLWNVPVNLNGVLGGGQIGYNYQFNPWLVLGFEADIQAADLRARQNIASAYLSPFWGVPSSGFATANQYVDWFGTARGRVGFTFPSYPNLLIFGTGGLAYGSVEYAHVYTRIDNVPPAWGSQAAATHSDTRVGWTAGGGVEWTPLAFPAWSLKVEYLYTDLGTVGQTGLGAASFGLGAPASLLNVSTNTVAFRWHTVRAGLNWHFNPFGAPAPVLAKY